MKPKPLSPAMRNMLHNAIHGKPLHTGMAASTVTHSKCSTVQALHRRGLLAGIDHHPTDAGRAYFAPATSQDQR